MKKKSRTIIFFGNERIATGVTTDAPILQALVDANYSVAAVVSSFERSASRSSRDLEIAKVAEANNIPLLITSNPFEIKDKISSYKPDAGILVAYGKIIPEPIINLFPHGIINVHPSLLPKHRGATPIESAILQGDRETGVSMMRLTKAMDRGPVYAQSKLGLRGDESKQELADKLLDASKSVLLEVLPDILDNNVQPQSQDDSQATYDRLLTKNDGVIDWNKPAEILEREIRAYAGWPKSRTAIGNTEVVITKARVLDSSGPAGKPDVTNKTLVVYCGKDALAIEMLKPAGKPEMSSQAFLAGYKASI